MNKKVYILLLVSLLTSSMYGQFVGKDNLSISLFYMQKTEVDSAKKYIDLASNDDDLKTMAKTWYWRGYIYKEIYKKREKNDKSSPLRLTAIESFKKMLSIEGSDEFMESTSKILKYLASTLYNDAARMLDPQNYNGAIDNYKLFRSTMYLFNPQVDLKARDIQFNLALASVLNKPKDGQLGLDSARLHQIKNLHLEILSLDPNNPVANYNLATLYYNQGADIINKMDYDMDIDHMNALQDKCVEIFLEGLPYMKKAHELNYKLKETLLGLSNIYLGLNDIEKYEAYKKELEDLEKE